MCVKVSPLVLEPRVRAPTIPWKNVSVEPLCARLSFCKKAYISIAFLVFFPRHLTS